MAEASGSSHKSAVVSSIILWWYSGRQGLRAAWVKAAAAGA
jgi:hypothetical protein